MPKGDENEIWKIVKDLLASSAPRMSVSKAYYYYWRFGVSVYIYQCWVWELSFLQNFSHALILEQNVESAYFGFAKCPSYFRMKFSKLFLTHQSGKQNFCQNIF